MKHNFLNNISSIFLLIFFISSHTTQTLAQSRQNSLSQISTMEKNSEIMNTVNTSIDRLDTSISNITAQLEEAIHTQKKATTANNNIIKDIKQQIHDINETNEKLSRELAIQKVETENLKNLISMYSETIKKLEQKLSNNQNTQTSITTQKNTISTPIIIEEETTTSSQNTTPNEIPQTATENPSDLLLQHFNTIEQSPTDTETKGSEQTTQNQPKPYTDDETFEMAFKTYQSKNYTDSAIQFATNIKAFPNGKNFHKNLLYLGKSMNKLNNKIGACTAFAKIIHSKEDIESKIKDEAEQGFNKLECNPQKTAPSSKKKK